MLLKKIKLQNIRSYLDQTIEFHEHTTLLSGDIGSGKSTILLAFEFALFGFLRGDTSGESLLRKGTPAGSVELTIAVNNKEYLIKRGLKKVSEKVVQDYGHIIEDGMKTELTPVEIKSKILSLLNYPEELVTKKSLIFRYTVYTPQEAMKQILFEDKQTRLDTLRKIFRIDRYKRIQENAALYTRQARSDMRGLSAQIELLPQKQTEVKQRESEIYTKQREIDQRTPELEVLKEAYEEQRQRVEVLEKRIELRKELEQVLKLCEQEINNKGERKTTLQNELQQLNSEIQKLQQDDAAIIITQLEKKSEDILAHIHAREKQVQELMKESGRIEIQMEIIKNEMNTILEMKNCPLCKQDVVHYHKENISRDMGQKISAQQTALNKVSIELNVSKKDGDFLKREYETLRKQEELNRIVRERKKQLETRIIEKLQRTNTLLQEGELIERKQKDLEAKHIQILKQLQETPVLDIQGEKNLLLKKQQLVHQKELQLLALQKEKESLVLISEQIQKQVQEMLAVQSRIQALKSYHDWLQDLFIPLMTTIEKHVFAQVHGEFNNYFQEWFSMLIEDENVSLSLDDEFTPAVAQNGYTIALEDLSGGEKTSIALAYRLSLNKVINEMMTEIQTKDLLVLDEPTDGFSSTQLDKVRNVLDQLNLRQIIIVSHESKIESFVQHVIRIQKEEHVSRVVV